MAEGALLQENLSEWMPTFPCLRLYGDAIFATEIGIGELAILVTDLTLSLFVYW